MRWALHCAALAAILALEVAAFRAGQLYAEPPRVPVPMDSEPILAPITVRYHEDQYGGHVEVYRIRETTPELVVYQHVWKYRE